MRAILAMENKDQWQDVFPETSKEGGRNVPGKIVWEETVRQILKKIVREKKNRGVYEYIINKIEKILIAIVLEEERGNQVRAAHRLGINRNTLRRKIKELAIISRVIAE